MDTMIPYELMEELNVAIGAGEIVYNLMAFALGIAGYVLRSIGLYTIAKRRGISNPWLAWIPVAWVWMLGSISDQFRYITKAQVKSKRKVLLILNIVSCVLSTAIVVLCFANLMEALELAMVGSEKELLTVGLTLMFQLLGLGLLAFGVYIAFSVFFYIALYDLYTSVNPPCNVLFLVFSILFNVTMPFFIFFNRKLDGGMPPRCEVPQPPVGIDLPAPPVQEAEEPAPEEE